MAEEHELERVPASLPREGTDLGKRLGLRVGEAAVAIGVSERHLRAHLSKVPHFHIGGCVVIPVDSLKEWLRAQARQEPREAEIHAQKVLDQFHE